MRGLFLLVAVASSLSLAYSECPKVIPMENFRDRDLLGHWYVVAQTNRSGDQAGYPLQNKEEMDATKKGQTWTLRFDGVDAKNGTKYNFVATGPQTGKAFLNLTMFCEDVQKYYNHDITVLGSDKRTFIVLFSCNFPNPNEGYYWVYSRRQVPLEKLPVSRQVAISKILTANGFSPFEVRRVKQ